MAYPQKTFAETKVHPGSLVGRRREIVSSTTLIYQLNVLKETGRYDAFKLGWHPSYSDPPLVWPIPNHLFWDSDVAKWIEGACYFLKQHSNSKVEAAVKELVEMIRSAQQPDGYLNIHFTVVEPTKRFTNLRDFHELYNAGHLIEAALAHQDLYNNDRFLETLLRYVDLLCATFGKGLNQLPGYPGHPEIELALLRLYEYTKDRKHLELATFFLTERGNPKGWYDRHYYDVESERRGDDPNKPPAYYPERRCLWYHQAQAFIAEQQTIEGHAVRAMYLLTAASDLVRVNPQAVDQKFEAAIYRLWDNMVQRKMYVTGGIGAMKRWEGFGLDYFLPQGTDEGGCYAETCAGIGVMMFAERLLQVRSNNNHAFMHFLANASAQLKLDGHFADVMELCFYNAVLTSMSHDGKRFTYSNQLASSDEELSQREEWFTCACCPPNVSRILGQIGGYVWSHHDKPDESSSEITVHLYVPSTLSFQVGSDTVELIQESEWPWGNGDIKFTLKTALPKVALRIPGWADSYKLSAECSTASTKNGYLDIPPNWLSQNSTFTLSIPLEPRLIAPHPFANQTTLSLARGPIVYCVEDADNPWVSDHFKAVQLDPRCKIEERSVYDDASGDSFVGLTVSDGASAIDLQKLQASPAVDAQASQHATPIKELQFVPYYFRANRGGKGQMRVGLRRAAPSAGK
ncbi:hypothetical protein LTR37_020122 [Vermiconidia calcicola]|uniref:Uncharacterized protein n=1 Tax=Vermiconidia calcicola TaxID=1690605 RepID=A0ACC3MC50_9PEZI|nr:hypothetical protein LTR37_020122 [Vermiconidia calcicola]